MLIDALSWVTCYDAKSFSYKITQTYVFSEKDKKYILENWDGLKTLLGIERDEDLIPAIVKAAVDEMRMMFEQDTKRFYGITTP